MLPVFIPQLTRKKTMRKVKLVIVERRSPVQDVALRLNLLKEAQKQFITHFFAENLPDGKTIEVTIGGEPQRVKKFIETVKRMGSGNPGPYSYKMETRKYTRNIMEIRDYAGYLTAEQLVIGVGAIGRLESTTSKGFESIGKLEATTSKGFKSIGKLEATTSKSIGKLEATTSKGFESVVEQLGHLPEKLAREMKRR